MLTPFLWPLVPLLRRAVVQLPAGPAVSALEQPFRTAAASCCSAAACQPCRQRSACTIVVIVGALFTCAVYTQGQLLL